MRSSILMKPFRSGAMQQFCRIHSVLTIALLVWGMAYCTPQEPAVAGRTTGNDTAPADLHQSFDTLLQQYVKKHRFDYTAIHRNREDLQKLRDYIRLLEQQDPTQWNAADALAYWINLYNAATLELVLQHYPVESIKDIGSLFSSPWKREVVTVNGKKLTLDEIENEIIRKQFGDARIHFALNCASISCPPLANRAYTGDRLEEQLEAVTRTVLNDPNWVKITAEKLQISKIFDWYEEDFVKAAGSVREFIARYRPADREKILDKRREIKYMDYNWELNQVGS